MHIFLCSQLVREAYVILEISFMIFADDRFSFRPIVDIKFLACITLNVTRNFCFDNNHNILKSGVL